MTQQSVAQPVAEELQRKVQRLRREAVEHKTKEARHRRAARRARQELDELIVICAKHGINVEVE